ncbi:MAG: transposase [Spirochaetaceae bacterium]|nr:transposase [Spirochaetaceae bacterium]
MKDVVRYSEAFKLRLVEDVANGKYPSLDEARRGNGIRGGSTLRTWIKRYGRGDRKYEAYLRGTRDSYPNC